MTLRAAHIKLHQFIRETRTRVETVQAEGEEATLKQLVLEELARLDAAMQTQTEATRRERVEAAQANDALAAAESDADVAYRRLYHLLSMNVLRQQLEGNTTSAPRRAVELFLEGTPPSSFEVYGTGAKVQALERCLSFESALGSDALSAQIVSDTRAALAAFAQAHNRWLVEAQEAKTSSDLLEQTVAEVRVRYLAARLILRAWLVRTHQEGRLSALMPPLRAATRKRRSQSQTPNADADTDLDDDADA